MSAVLTLDTSICVSSSSVCGNHYLDKCHATHLQIWKYLHHSNYPTTRRIRIRRAFGVLSYLDESNGNLLPLDLSTVFECLKKYEKSIAHPLKLENIERIYKWLICMCILEKPNFLGYPTTSKITKRIKFWATA